MGGEKKKAGSAGGDQEKKKVDTTPIQEYDFFVRRDDGVVNETAPADHAVKRKAEERAHPFFSPTDVVMRKVAFDLSKDNLKGEAVNEILSVL